MKSISMKTKNTLIEAIAVVSLAVLLSLALRYALTEATGLETPIVIVRGHSMYPFFLDGDLVVISREDINKIELGDIIVYRTLEGKMIIHRVIGKRKIAGNIALTVKGDNNPLPDIPPITKSKLVGKVNEIRVSSGREEIAIVPKIPLIGRFIPVLRE